MDNSIDKYEIIKQLGTGSAGIVCKARDSRLNRVVAIKILKSISLGETSDEPTSAYQRFLREAQLACRLRHPNIITIYDVGLTDVGAPYIVMEYVEGKDLGEIIDVRGALPPDEVLLYLEPLALAIDYAHSQGIVHRDIKPNNVVINRQGQPYLLDFSVAKLHDTSLTPAGTLLGTPEYMAPEQFSGMPCDHRADIFSFSVLAFEMLTGDIPFEGKDLMGTANLIVRGQPKTFAEVDCPLPLSAEKILCQGMAKNPSDRYQKAIELVNDLRLALQEKAPKIIPKKENIDACSVATPPKNPLDEDFAAPFDQEFDSPFSGVQITAPVLKTSSVTRYLQASVIVLGFLVIVSFTYYFLTVVFPSPQTTRNAQASTANSSTSEQLASNLGDKIPSLSDIELLTMINAHANDTALLRQAIPEIAKRNNDALFRKAMTFSDYADYQIKIAVLKLMTAHPHSLSEDEFINITRSLLADNNYLVRGFAVKSLGALKSANAQVLLQEQQLKETDYVVNSVIAAELRNFK